MKNSLRVITVSAMLAALAAAVLYMSSFLPYAELSLAAIAGLFTAAAVIECGLSSAIGCYIVSAALALILSPIKTVAVLYAVFFGYYPIAKSAFERRGRFVEWVLKLLLANTAITASVLLMGFGFIADFEPSVPVVIAVYLVLNACFVVYDIAFSRLVATYIRRIHKKR